MGIATVRGEFTDFEGTPEIAEDLASSKAYGTVKATSVDINEAQRVAHRCVVVKADRDSHVLSGFGITQRVGSPWGKVEYGVLPTVAL